jgi:hypothetical protein
MTISVDALQELEALEPQLSAQCCSCAYWSAFTTFVTCFGCTLTR